MTCLSDLADLASSLAVGCGVNFTRLFPAYNLAPVDQLVEQARGDAQGQTHTDIAFGTIQFAKLPRPGEIFVEHISADFGLWGDYTCTVDFFTDKRRSDISISSEDVIMAPA